MDNEQPNPIELSTHSQKTREESPLQINPIFETSLTLIQLRSS